MATYASLTADQQALVQSFVNGLRGADIKLQAVMSDALVLGAAWNGGVSTIVQSLDAGETIPNTSGLDGAQGLAPADVTNTAGYFIDMSNSANTVGGGGYNTPFHQALRVKFAGINASINA